MVDVLDDEMIADSEAYRWEGMRDSVVQLIYELDEKRRACIRETGNSLQPEYDKVELMLGQLQDYMDGQIEAIQPRSYHRSNAFKDEREAIDYAAQEGVNYVALKDIYPASRRIEAVDYITKHGLASRDYEATCRAVSEYDKARTALFLQQLLQRA